MNNFGTSKTRKPLGRGLSALLPPKPLQTATPPASEPEAVASPSVLPIDAIAANPDQPRTVFRADRLEELAASIRAQGIIQPLIVRRQGESYQIIAGERRWRAAKMAGLTEVPVAVQDVLDGDMLKLALIENIQREDLNPIETAHAYDRLARELKLSQEEIARSTGKDRTSITNTLRLLRLPPEVQLLLAENRIFMGHARALLGLDSAEDQIRLAEKAAAQGLSVRQVETLVQEATNKEPSKGTLGGTRGQKPKQDPNVAAAELELARVLQTRVKIVELSKERGHIEIQYYSEDELERIYEWIVKGPPPSL
jgi:ParB family transcriptional regulator, chromosome partitioning protein